MSRAKELLFKLEHFGRPSVNEQNPEEQTSDDNAAMNWDQGQEQGQERSMDPQQQMGDPNSPFSKDVRNPDGSMKMSNNDQPINDRGRFTVRRRR